MNITQRPLELPDDGDIEIVQEQPKPSAAEQVSFVRKHMIPIVMGVIILVLVLIIVWLLWSNNSKKAELSGSQLADFSPPRQPPPAAIQPPQQQQQQPASPSPYDPVRIEQMRRAQQAQREEFLRRHEAKPPAASTSTPQHPAEPKLQEIPADQKADTPGPMNQLD